jgi:hypothetical protein
VGKAEGGGGKVEEGATQRIPGEERGASEVRIVDFELRVAASEESRVKSQEPEQTATGRLRWRDDALLASRQSGGESQKEEAVGTFVRRGWDEGSGGSILDAVDSAFEKLLADVA